MVAGGFDNEPPPSRQQATRTHTAMEQGQRFRQLHEPAEARQLQAEHTTANIKGQPAMNTIDDPALNLIRLHQICGMNIRTNPLLTIPGPLVEVRSTWKERLFTMPWRPWIRTRGVISQIPSREMYMLPDNTIVMHPELWREVREAIARAEQVRAVTAGGSLHNHDFLRTP